MTRTKAQKRWNAIRKAVAKAAKAADKLAGDLDDECNEDDPFALWSDQVVDWAIELEKIAENKLAWNL